MIRKTQNDADVLSYQGLTPKRIKERAKRSGSVGIQP